MNVLIWGVLTRLRPIQHTSQSYKCEGSKATPSLYISFGGATHTFRLEEQGIHFVWRSKAYISFEEQGTHFVRRSKASMGVGSV